MSFYRWILFPLICAVLLTITLGISFAIVGIPLVSLGLLLGFVLGAIMGIFLQLYNEHQTRKIIPDAFENDFEINQTRQCVLSCGYSESFDLCLKAIDEKLKASLKNSDKATGKIEAKTKMTLNRFGNAINFKVNKLSENTTEIEVSTLPRMPTTVADFGEGLKIIKDLEEFFQRENERRSLNLLVEKSEIPLEIYYNNVKIESN